jgi:hypothetical protein
VVTLFLVESLDPATVYVLRLYLGLAVGVFFFVGIRSRQRATLAIVAAGATALTSMAALLGGNRGDAMLPIIVLGAGYIVSRPTPPAQMARWLTAAAVLFFGMLYIGSALRSDERGRTGEALMARFDNLGATVTQGVGAESATETTILRLLRGSTHAVIMSIPGEVPYEADGLAKMPEEFAERLLPQWNLTGTSDTGARNWMLNELGFLVTWTTSVELSLVADGWYRGGVVGVALVALIVALSLRLLEAFVVWRSGTRPEYIITLVFAASGIYLVEGRDIIWGIRTMVFLVGAAEIVLLSARWLGLAQSAPAGTPAVRQGAR